MKSQELRIGNYLDRNGLMEVRVICAGSIKINDTVNKRYWPTYFDIDTFNPIPLTEEWLLKFGFVHDCATTDIHFWIDMVTHYLELRDFQREWYPVYCQIPEMSHEGTQRCGINAIRYVHQLQNLYYALTGEELIMKGE